MFVNPEEIIKNFEIRPGMVVADFGCGSGRYVLAIAKKMKGFDLPVGQAGVVYAIDIQKNLLESIKLNAEKEHLADIVDIIWADIEAKDGVRLATATIDLIVASNILFQISDKESLVKEIHRVLKDGGRVAIIDWSVAGMGIAPKSLIAKKEAERIFIENGFLRAREFPAGDNHYGIIFKKLQPNSS